MCAPQPPFEACLREIAAAVDAGTLADMPWYARRRDDWLKTVDTHGLSVCTRDVDKTVYKGGELLLGFVGTEDCAITVKIKGVVVSTFQLRRGEFKYAIDDRFVLPVIMLAFVEAEVESTASPPTHVMCALSAAASVAFVVGPVASRGVLLDTTPRPSMIRSGDFYPDLDPTLPACTEAYRMPDMRAGKPREVHLPGLDAAPLTTSAGARLVPGAEYRLRFHLPGTREDVKHHPFLWDRVMTYEGRDVTRPDGVSLVFSDETPILPAEPVVDERADFWATASLVRHASNRPMDGRWFVHVMDVPSLVEVCEEVASSPTAVT